MSDIPEDIRKMAWGLIQSNSCLGAGGGACTLMAGCGCYNDIASAVLEERQRCARAVFRRFAPNQGESMDPAVIDVLRAINRVQLVPSADS